MTTITVTANSSLTTETTNTATAAPAFATSVPATVEAAYKDSACITVRSRTEFVTLFRTCEAKTALATLEMCRAVYEAKSVLSEAEFNAFCSDIGYSDTSSTIRKFLAIGKVAPRLFELADKLPASWTAIYMLTQIPASIFERMVEGGRIFREIKASAVKKLVDETRVARSITADLPVDAEKRSILFAKVWFTKMPVDDIDWRAMRKAFAEIESRLPLRFEIDKGAEEAWQKRKDAMYEQSKVRFKLEHFKPDLWDFGREANAIAKKTLPVDGGETKTASTEEAGKPATEPVA